MPHCRIGKLLVLGHSPGWEDVVAALTGRWVRMTTANAALLESETDDRAEAIRTGWVYVDTLRPREL